MKKYDTFKEALKNLKLIFSYHEPYGTVEITGIVGLYKICFEQARKAMKEILERNNVAHAYNEGIALDIVNLTKNQYSRNRFANPRIRLTAQKYTFY